MHEDPGRFDLLPPRLAALLVLIGEGRSNQQIATHACLALHTVENYVSEILERTGCDSRSELIARFLQSRA